MTNVVPHPLAAPANPRTFLNRVPTRDPFGFIRADDGGASALAESSALLYNHGKGTVHDDLIGYLRGGGFGEGVDYAQYRHSNAVTLEETTPVDITALPPRIFFGAVNTHDGYLAKHNDMNILFPVVLLGSHRPTLMWQQKLYREEILPQATVRSLVPSLRNSEQSCEFHLQQIGGSTEITIESVVHGTQELVEMEILRRLHQLELSFHTTICSHMARALATAPTAICHWLMQLQNSACNALMEAQPNKSRWVHKVLTKQLTTFCPSQFRNVSMRDPIRDLIKGLKKTSPEDDASPIYLATTATVTGLLTTENKDTITLPETQRIFYLEEDGNSKNNTFKPLQSFPGIGKREASQLPFIQVDGQNLPIVKMPDSSDKNGENTSPFVSRVTGMFAVPIGYALKHVPEVSTFREVDFNTVRMTAFDKGGEDGEIQWHRDVLCRSGLNDPALYDPHEYDKAMLTLDGGEAAVTAFRECFRGQDAYDSLVFSPTGITPRDREFNLCVSNHTLYVNRSFGRTLSKTSTFAGLDPRSKFRATGIDGNRPLCTATGYLQSARSAIADMHDMKKDAANAFQPFLEECLGIPFDHNVEIEKKNKDKTRERDVFAWLSEEPNFERVLFRQLRRLEVDDRLFHILRDVFLGNGVSKWMNMPRVLFAILEAANLGLFTPALHTLLETTYGIASILSGSKFQETVERLRKIHSAIDTFCRDAMTAFAVNDTNVHAYIFHELPTVLPVANVPRGTDTADSCDRDVPRAKLFTRRMFVETVLNLLATQMYAYPVEDTPDNYEYVFQLQVHDEQKRCETYRQPYFAGGFYTTYEYDVESMDAFHFTKVTGHHPLLGGKPSPDVSESRKNNFFHCHISRQFADLRCMYGVSFTERVIAALACMRPHTPANAKAISPRVMTHTAAQIVRPGTFETHRLVAIRGGHPENMYNGFIACTPPVLLHRRTSNGGVSLSAFMQTAPVLPSKSTTTTQLPHYFCGGCISGMGSRMANIQGCLDRKTKLSSAVFDEDAFAVPVPSCFGYNEFGVPFFPIDGVYGASFLQERTRCDRPDPLHVMEGAYSYNPMTRSNAPSEILVLNRRLRAATSGQVELPPWSTKRRSLSGCAGLRQRLARLDIARKEGMKPDAQLGPGNSDNHLDISPDDQMCMFERFYHPGLKGHEYGQKSRSILGENSNSSLNWTQTLETQHRTLNQLINPLDQQGRNRLISDVPKPNGFAY